MSVSAKSVEKISAAWSKNRCRQPCQLVSTARSALSIWLWTEWKRVKHDCGCESRTHQHTSHTAYRGVCRLRAVRACPPRHPLVWDCYSENGYFFIAWLFRVTLFNPLFSLKPVLYGCVDMRVRQPEWGKITVVYIHRDGKEWEMEKRPLQTQIERVAWSRFTGLRKTWSKVTLLFFQVPIWRVL